MAVLLSANYTPLVSVDLIGEKNQVILEMSLKLDLYDKNNLQIH